MTKSAFGVDYRSGDFAMTRISSPSAIAQSDIERRFTTSLGIVWWKTLRPGQLPDDPEPCLDIRDIPLDSGLISGLSARLEEVAMASPFVDNAQTTDAKALPDGSIIIKMLITIKTGVTLTLQIRYNPDTGEPEFGFITTMTPITEDV